MSHPQPPQRQPTSSEAETYAKAVHTTALVAVVACPALALLPPRKFDFYTLGLIGTTAYSANYLLRERTGRSIWQHLGGGQRRTLPDKIPDSPSVVGEIQRQARGGVGAREAWKAQREQEIKQDVEEGKGFGDMIVDQIWEVWNWGKPKNEEDE